MGVRDLREVAAPERIWPEARRTDERIPTGQRKKTN